MLDRETRWIDWQEYLIVGWEGCWTVCFGGMLDLLLRSHAGITVWLGCWCECSTRVLDCWSLRGVLNCVFARYYIIMINWFARLRVRQGFAGLDAWQENKMYWLTGIPDWVCNRGAAFCPWEECWIWRHAGWFVRHGCWSRCLTGMLHWVFDSIVWFSVPEGCKIPCLTGMLHSVFGRDAALRVWQGCYIKCLTGMLHGVIYRDAQLSG